MAGLTVPGSAAEALRGRDIEMAVPDRHFVLGTPLKGLFPEGLQVAYFALGCFWGAERMFWSLEGVYTTVAGYQGGFTPNPTYEEVCSGLTGHAESVMVVFDPGIISYAELCRAFFEDHDPTQGMRQGNDVGTQYRSAAYVLDDTQRATVESIASSYGTVLAKSGFGPITTEIVAAGTFYYGEGYHQQYLAKNPWGYCGVGGTGVACPVGLGVAAER